MRKFVNSIKSRIILAYSVTLIFFILMEFFQITSLYAQLKAIRDMQKTSIEVGMKSYELKISVIQVQQFLTDSAVTKDKQVINEAKEYSNKFYNTLEDIIKINPEEKEELVSMKDIFSKYESLGIEMVNKYINEGTESGNKVMDEFDVESEQINTKVDKYRQESITNIEETITNLESKGKQITIFVGITGLIIILLIILMAKSLIRRINGPISEVLEHIKDMSEGEGDLTRRLAPSGISEIDEMLKYINKFIDNIENLVSKTKVVVENTIDKTKYLSLVADQNTEAANELAATSQEVSAAMTNQAVFVQKSTEKTKHIAESINKIATSISDVLEYSNETSSQAQTGNKQIHRAICQIDSMHKSTNDLSKSIALLKEKSQAIGEISQVIMGIAKQTNLLALNASIEAARAGEHGRGFAVVAEEVRKLADESSSSSDHISSLISEIRAEIEKSVSSMEINIKDSLAGKSIIEEAGMSFDSILVSIEGITNYIGSIEGSSIEILQGTKDVNDSVEQILASTKEIGSGVEQLSSSTEEQLSSMEELDDIAHTLNELSKEVQLLVNMFKVRI